jgi:nucleotide-binding universal stress UspA family protein
MIKTILVPTLDAIVSPQALDLSLQMARLFNGHIECLHVHPDARELARYTSSLNIESSTFSGKIWEAMVDGDKKCTKGSRRAFDDFCSREHLICCGETNEHWQQVTMSWREVDGNARAETTLRAFYNDLVVFARPALPDDLTTTGISDILVDGGRPLLLAPSRPCINPLSNIVIAWKDTAPSVRAVAAAMPLLAKAKKVDILGIAEGDQDGQPILESAEQLAEHLRWHGLKPQTGHVFAGDRNACDVLLESADKLRAGLLVMGGYGHSRAHEFIFGGFTRRILHSAPLPIFLSH